MANILLLSLVALCAAQTNYPGAAMFLSFEDIRHFVDYAIKFTLEPETELPLYSLPIKDDDYRTIFLAD